MLSPIQKFIDAFSKLPSIGPRAATRLALYIAQDKTTLLELQRALEGLTHLDRCERCFFFKNENEPMCEICANPKRNPSLIAIVEKETDILAIEKSGKWDGHYLILGSLSESGILETTHKLRLTQLKKRIVNELQGTVKELVIALNPTTFGDFMTSIIKEEFKSHTTHITRLGRGIPTGGEIEFADEETLESAITRRN